MPKSANMTDHFASRFLSTTVALHKSRKIATLDVEPRVVEQLTGIYIHVDIDGDGFISRGELEKALSFVGITPRDTMIKKYIDTAFRNSPTKRASVSSGNPSRMAAHLNTLKLDLASFISVTVGELDKVKQASRDIDPLLKFMTIDNADTEQISVRQLRHLLVETLAPTRLDEKEFRVFIEALGISQSMPQRQLDEKTISVSELKRRMLFE